MLGVRLWIKFVEIEATICFKLFYVKRGWISSEIKALGIMFIFVLRKQIHNSLFLSHFLNFLKSTLFCIESFGCSFPFGNSKGFIYLNSLITYPGNLPLQISPIIEHVICSGFMSILTSANIKFRTFFFFNIFYSFQTTSFRST